MRPTLSIRPPPSQTETDAPPAHSTLLSLHPTRAHLREGRKVTSTGLRAEQYWSPISTSTGRNSDHYWSRREPVLVTRPFLYEFAPPTSEQSLIDSVSQTSLPTRWEPPNQGREMPGTPPSTPAMKAHFAAQRNEGLGSIKNNSYLCRAKRTAPSS